MRGDDTHFHIQKSRIDLSPSETWRMLADIHTLARTAPPWIKVEYVNGPLTLQPGNLFEMKIKNGLLKGTWQMRVTHLRKDFLIGFEVLSPSKRKWVIWTKTLPAENPNTCIIEDRIEYKSSCWFGKTSKRMDEVFKRIVFYRHRTLKNDIAVFKRLPTPRKQKIVIAGGTGLVGRNISRILEMRGHEVHYLSTKESYAGDRASLWNPEKGLIEDHLLEGADTVINLAGFPVACRWNSTNRERIRNSRIQSANLLTKTLSRLNHPPQHYIQASGIGFYGYEHGDRNFSETNTWAGNGFLAAVCRDWETETELLKDTPTKVSIARMGAVLTFEGGALKEMLPAFKMGLGGKLGDGKQRFPWITIDDLCRVFVYLIENPDAAGIFNVCAPHCPTQAEFAREFGKVLGKPTWLTTPAFVLKLLYGSMAKEMLLGGVRAEPERLLSIGFEFSDNAIEDGIKNVCP